MSDIFLKLKHNAEKDILGKDFGVAQALLRGRYMEVVKYENHMKHPNTKRMCVQVEVDEFNKIIEIVGWL